MGNILNDFQENICYCKKKQKVGQFYKNSIYLYKKNQSKPKLISQDQSLFLQQENVFDNQEDQDQQEFQDFIQLSQGQLTKVYSNLILIKDENYVHEQNYQQIIMNSINNDLEYDQKYLSKFILNTQQQLIKKSNKNNLNQNFMLLAFQQILQQIGINLICDNGKIQQDFQKQKCLSLRNIHCLNFPDFYGFYQIYIDKTQIQDINLFKQYFQSLIIQFMQENNNFFYQQDICYQKDIFKWDSYFEFQDQIVINLFIQRMKRMKQKEINENLIIFLKLRNINIVQQDMNLYANENDFEIWKDHNYNYSQQQIEKIGNYKYQHPYKGFKRFGLKIIDQFNNNIWIQKNKNSWPAGYVDIMLFNNLKSNGEHFIYKLFKTKDVGPNKENFESKFCQLGILVFLKIPYIQQYYKNLKKKHKIFISQLNTSCSFLVQVRVNPMKLRIPFGFENELFIINELSDIRPYGILIRIEDQ